MIWSLVMIYNSFENTSVESIMVHKLDQNHLNRPLYQCTGLHLAPMDFLYIAVIKVIAVIAVIKEQEASSKN